MHTSECLAGSQHRHANDDIGLHGAHGRVRLAETGVGIGGTNPHLEHALERRQYPLCGREIPCLPQRITRGSNGLRTVIHTPTARPPPNADDCQASLKRLAERQRGSRAAPFARRPPVRACATSDANLRPGSRVRHALASRARRCPMDATRRLASLPRHVRDGTTRRMRARHPTRNRVLHTGHASRHRK